ncbi:hypothetical protein HDE_10013 [Halotydeus destructor]|nr:hypothetical protein HDE_10013 [Halotydeus destructor]
MMNATFVLLITLMVTCAHAAHFASLPEGSGESPTIDCKDPAARQKCLHPVCYGAMKIACDFVNGCEKCKFDDEPGSSGSVSTPASAPGWMDDDQEPQQGRSRYGQDRQNYNHGGQGYGQNAQGYRRGSIGRYGNHHNGNYDNGYGRKNGYNRMSTNMNYGPPVQSRNMGYDNEYN